MSENKAHSCLAHMGVFRLGRETTKCRVVFLSNICEKDPSKPLTVNHNQAMYAGPCLNKKIASLFLHLRFDFYLLCFDISKAFNNLALSEIDSNRVLCLWFRNVSMGDYRLIAYRSKRLPFGLRCSPTLLLLALYKILVLDSSIEGKLDDLKKCIYQLCYMDNCAVTANVQEYIKWAYEQLPSIFGPYRFPLQQFVTNDTILQDSIDKSLNVDSDTCTKLLVIIME